MADTLNLTIKYITLIIGVLATVLAVGLYLTLAQNKRAEVAVAIAAAGVALTALIYSALNVHLFYETQEKMFRLQSETLSVQRDALDLQGKALAQQIEANSTQAAMLDLQKTVLSLQQESRSLQDTDKRVARKIHAMHFVMQWNEPETTKLTVVAKALGKNIKELDPKEVAIFLQNEDNKDNQHSILLVLNFLENMALAIKHELADDEFLKEYFRDIVRFYYYTLQAFIQAEVNNYQSDDIYIEFKNLVKKWGQLPPKGESK